MYCFSHVKSVLYSRVHMCEGQDGAGWTAHVMAVMYVCVSTQKEHFRSQPKNRLLYTDGAALRLKSLTWFADVCTLWSQGVVSTDV